MKAITVSSLFFITLFTAETFAAANVTFVEAFINCTETLIDFPLLYNVTENGSLMLAPINSTSNSADYDLSGFHACAQLFGLLFDVYVDFGQARYHPDAIMLPLEMAAADSIVTAGLEQKQHPGINSTSNNNSSNAALV